VQHGPALFGGPMPRPPRATTDSCTPRGKRGIASQSRGLPGTAGGGSCRTTHPGEQHAPGNGTAYRLGWCGPGWTTMDYGVDGTRDDME
jgi:hypothetical protein